jgi:hypothetical protein
MKKIFLALAVTIFACDAHAECQFSSSTMEVSGENCPKDVIAIVEKMQACRHFENEPYDLNEEVGRWRKKFLDKRIRELKCRTSENELKIIRKKYKSDARIINFIEKYEYF